MLLLIALAAGLIVGALLWQSMVRRTRQLPAQPNPPRRVTAPDDDPEFLRKLGEQLRQDGEDPPRRR